MITLLRRATGRLAAAMTIGVAALTISACGGGSDDQTGDGELKGPSSQQVAAHFLQVTGAALKSVDGVRTAKSTPWDLLSLPPSADRYEQYGVFSLYVVRTAKGREILLGGGASKQPEVHFGTDGVGFQRNKGGDSYSVYRRFGSNVLVIWQAGEARRTDARFERLSQAIGASVSGKLSTVPTSERQCASVGIDPDQGKEGSCRLGETKLTIVNAKSQLRTPEIGARLSDVRQAGVVPSQLSFGTPARARGRFVIVTYRLTNAGNEPIESIEPELVVAGKTYAASSEASYNLEGNDRALPAQPGETVTLKEAFDIPPPAAALASKQGALSLPVGRSETGSSLDGDVAQGRIRLSGAAPGVAPKPAPRPSAPSLPTPSVPTPSPRSRDREHAVETALKSFFKGIRTRDVRTVCARLSKSYLKKLDGVNGCRSSRFVKSSAARMVPRSSRGVRLTTLLTRHDTRATVIISAGKGYHGIASMSRESGRWRVRGVRRSKFKLPRIPEPTPLPPRNAHPS